MSVLDPRYRGTQAYGEVYRLLIEAARDHQLTHYRDVAVLMGIEPSGDNMRRETGYLIGEISEEEHRAGRPMLSALVVRIEDGVPGDGLYDLARDLGRLAATDPGAELVFWCREVEACYSAWEQKPSGPGHPRK